MECNKDEAIRAKNIAENKMRNNDFESARKFALKAQKLYPELDNISQILAVCDVHCSAQRKINGAQMDLYGILQVESLADEATIRKQYRKLALVLHPDKNHFPGAEAAFKLIGEANMILSDKGKRCLHDFKCRDPAKPTVSKPENPQENQSSQSGARSKYFNGYPHSKSDSNVHTSFWTKCPFCKFEYEYYKDMLNKKVKCPKCLKFFIAIDIRIPKSSKPPQSGPAGMQNVNPGSNTGRPVSFQQENVQKQKNANVDAKKADPRTGDEKIGCNSSGKTVGNGDVNTKEGKKGVASKETDRKPSDSSGKNVEYSKGSRKTVGNGDVNTREGKKGVASKETDGKPSDSSGKEVEYSKRSRKRSQVFYSEKVVDDITPGKRSRVDKQKDKVCNENESKENKLKEDVISVSDSENDSEPVFFDVQDPEFSNFDKHKEEKCFAVDQFWAIYDTIDGMPRFYAQIRKVFSSGFKLRITWLEADPENMLEKNWAEEGLPVACGRFKRGETEETQDRLMFSHQIAFAKGSKRSSFVIYPRKGEIWALFKNWDMDWSSDPKSHMEYKFEIVEILSDYDKDKGVFVAYMVKVKGFLFLFQKTNCTQLAEYWIPSGEIFRFSHRIPSEKLTGMEREDVPADSYELDPASLPDDLDQFYLSNDVKLNPEHISEQTHDSCFQPPERKVKDFDNEMPKGFNGNFEQSIGAENKSNIGTSSNTFTKPAEFSSISSDKEAITIHDFKSDKRNWKFQEGQIWALGRNLRCYAQIKKIESSPFRLHVDLLELCSDAIRPNACGLYKRSTGASQIFEQDSFLYLVKAEVNGKNRFNIYPREKETWVLCKKQDSNYTFSDLDCSDAGDHEIVEVVENNGDMIKVLFLSRVCGYKSVFRALDKVQEIPITESNIFFYRVPAFLLTEENDGQLRGCWEIDLEEFPGLLSG